jgi:hypothetical protein
MTTIQEPEGPPKNRFLRVSRSFFTRNSVSNGNGSIDHGTDDVTTEKNEEDGTGRPTTKWSLGVLNVPETHEVPGTSNHPKSSLYST